MQVHAFFQSFSEISLLSLSDEVDLQGSVKMYTVQVLSNLRNYTRDLGPADMSAVFEGLNPNTVYYVTVTITIHGGASITSDPVSVKTLDGGKDSFKLLEFVDSAYSDNDNGDIYNMYFKGMDTLPCFSAIFL